MKTKTFKLASVLTVVIIVTLFSSSCSYFRVIPVTDYSSSTIHTYDTSGKYIVLKREEEAWHIYDIQSKEDSITASLDIYLGNNVNHLYPKTKGLNKFNRKEEAEVKHTVHLFTDDSSFLATDTKISIPESAIYRVDEFRYAISAYRASIAVPIILGLPVLAIAGIFTAFIISGGMGGMSMY